MITPENFKYIIECKKGYNDEQVSDLFNPKSTICKMIAQAHRDSQKSSRKFLLIIGQNRQDPVAITNQLDLPVSSPSFKGKIEEIEILLSKLDNLLDLSDRYFLT